MAFVYIREEAAAYASIREGGVASVLTSGRWRGSRRRCTSLPIHDSNTARRTKSPTLTIVCKVAASRGAILAPFGIFLAVLGRPRRTSGPLSYTDDRIPSYL